MPFDGKEFEVELSETTKLLIEGRNKIAEGWCQGSFYKQPIPLFHPARYCMMGAIGYHSATECATVGAKFTAYKLLGDVVVMGVSFWNDAPGRTKAEVLTAFDQAIELSKQRDRTNATP
jgi:hypothetical protein